MVVEAAYYVVAVEPLWPINRDDPPLDISSP